MQVFTGARIQTIGLVAAKLQLAIDLKYDIDSLGSLNEKKIKEDILNVQQENGTAPTTKQKESGLKKVFGKFFKN